MIDTVFDLCVRILLSLADGIGMTYKAVNVWIFCVAWPVLTLVLIGVVIRQQLIIRALRRERPAPGKETP